MALFIAGLAGIGIGVLAGTVLLSKFVAPTLNPGPDVGSEASAIMRRRSQFCFILEAITFIAAVVLIVAVWSMSLTTVGKPQHSPDLWMQITAAASGLVALMSGPACITIREGARRRAKWLLPPTEAVPSGPQPPLAHSLLFVGVIYGVLASFAVEGSDATVFAVIVLAALLAATRVIAVAIDWVLFVARFAWHTLLRSVAAGNGRAVRVMTAARNFERHFESRKRPVSEPAVQRLTALAMPAAPSRPGFRGVVTLTLSVVLAVLLVAWQARRPGLSEVVTTYNNAQGSAIAATEAWPHAAQALMMTALVAAIMLYGLRLMLGAFATEARRSLRRTRSTV